MVEEYRSRRRRAAHADWRSCEVIAFDVLEPRLLLATGAVTTPAGSQSGIVPISYTLTDAESDVCSIVVEYSPDGGTNWYGAAAGSGGDGTTGLSSSPTGVAHSYVWSSVTDLGSVSNSTVQIRITPTDAGGPGAAADTANFSVDNTQIPSAFVTTPSGTKTGNVTISYTLKDTESETCSILVEYSSDGGTNWSTATKGTGGDSTTGLTSSPAGTSHTYVWNSTTDLGAVLNTTVRIRITPTDADGTGKAASTTNFTVDNIVHPSVTVTTPSGTQTGDVTITYKLIDAQSDVCSVLVEYSTDGGTNWSTATKGTGGDNITGLTSSPSGTTHTYVWDSATDTGPVLNSSIKIRITATDAGGTGAPTATNNFTVNNRTSPSVVLTTPVGTQTGDVTITYTLTDAESDTCSITVQYSTDGGTNWLTATKGTGGDNTTGLTSSPGGTSHTFVWNSRANLGTVVNDQVQIRITPSDPQGAGVRGSTGDFTVNNLATADIFWRNLSNGTNVLWFMQEGNVSTAQLLASATPDWRVMGSGDFNGDGQLDLLWRNVVHGYNGVWLMQNGNVVDARWLRTVVEPGWYIAGVGDLSGDGRSDILWRNAAYGGVHIVWFMIGGEMVAWDYLPSVPGSTWFPYVADYNGDGTSDILWREQSGGTNVLWLMSAGEVYQSRILLSFADSNWWVAGIGDFDGNGDKDILWRHATAGANAVWLMNDGNIAGGAMLPTVGDLGWRVVSTGDFNADGTSDILWRHLGVGANVIWSIQNAQPVAGYQIVAVPDLTWTVAAVGEMGSPTASLIKGVSVGAAVPAVTGAYKSRSDVTTVETATVIPVVVVAAAQKNTTGTAPVSSGATGGSRASDDRTQARKGASLDQPLSSELDTQLDSLS